MTDPWANLAPAERKASLIHCARVYLREAHARRGTAFSETLRTWAGNARREAAAIDLSPLQRELF